MNSKRYLTRRALPKRNALVVALALGMGISGLAYGQATSGAIFGTAPAGDTVTVTSSAGATRSATVAADGSYSVTGLPLGSYTVTLSQGGNTVSSRNDVSITAGGGTAVNFAGGSSENAQNLSAVSVTANALPAIDVTTVADTTTITAQQLKQLPVGRNMTDIALLTPGTMQSTAFGGVTFGGSSVSENAYYVNGYNTGEPYRNMSGFQLPYGAIQQQQTMAGGFSAKYGRADGGVISQIGKSGTNEWHFGGQIVWQPEHLAAAPRNHYYPTNLPNLGTLPDGSTYTIQPNYTDPAGNKSYVPGKLYNYDNNDKGWETVYTAYIGGPLIKDKLFFFIDGEYTEDANHSVSAVTSPYYTYSTSHQTKFYGKLNWNINDSNILEATFLNSKYTGGQGARYHYDYDTNETGEFSNINNKSVNNAKFEILKYTSYITDNATLEVTFGKGTFDNPTIYGVDTGIPLVGGLTAQDPAILASLGVDPNVGIGNKQVNASVADPASHLATHGLRADFTYVLGDHTLGVGIDNMSYSGQHQGTIYTGGNAPDYVASRTVNGAPTDGTRWIYYNPAPGEYYVRYLNIANAGNMSVKQKAYYLMDKWQLTPNLLLNLGIRNDHFSNYNGEGVAFVDQKNQWEPRLGVSWDVFGDSSLKVFGNVGRYYLALPTNAANRAADASTYIWSFYTYTGINPDGTPSGLGDITDADAIADGYASQMVSPDGEFGNPKDPKQVVSQNLKPMYIDQFNIGFDAKLGENWTYGAKFSYRALKATIDDECMPNAVADKMRSMGYNPDDYYNSLYVAGACRLLNPGRTNIFAVQNDATGDYVQVPMSFEDWGYPKKPKRRYESLNVYFGHPFDGKWQGRADLTYTKAKGNTTGQVRPDFGQSDVSKTEDWDSGPLMEGADGELLNTRKWVFRLRGSYAFTPEWMISAVARIQSGAPRECLGYYGVNADGDPTGYNGGGTGNYHWCAGRLVHPGSDDPLAGHQPWTHTIDLSVNWTPAFADHKMNFQLAVFNALNEQRAVGSLNQSLVSGVHQINDFWQYPQYQDPRTVRLSVSYDY